MSEHQFPPTEVTDEVKYRLAKRVRVYAVVYRIVLVAGLLLLAASAVLIFFTRRTYLWLAVVSIGLIGLGILLAWVEYRLVQRFYVSGNQVPPQGED